MNVEITGRHVIITPAIRSYVLKRLRKFVRLLGEEVSTHVILGVEKDRHTAEILMKSKLVDLTGSGETKDMYSSILLAIEKLERQALRRKARVIENKRHLAKSRSLAERTGLGRDNQASVRGANGIQEEESSRKPMAIEEAVLELGQSDYPFVVFRNSESGDVNVLYRRKDGSLGLIHT
jgi:putative sigma-54 modulation protein